ncbi:hypothetical protein FJ951_11810 [Mesorhizobium sp. B2-2-3]|uniref:hypothetical protein n=1 Tax=Mesorhizobium sp. B2-2-3 TaxID=2589963 RepID=UPI00112B8967|nr:hypothetical protein [Mesorhizobium sp. B2-2-3]TPM48515.1 hypothetical protein FJ951_11810 [Mesorhizobium sp. B2-2-3]
MAGIGQVVTLACADRLEQPPMAQRRPARRSRSIVTQPQCGMRQTFKAFASYQPTAPLPMATFGVSAFSSDRDTFSGQARQIGALRARLFGG